MVSQASQMPPETEFATKADLASIVQTLIEEFRSEIEASEQRIRADFTKALEASEQRLRADFTKALEASEQRLRADFAKALEASEQRLRADFTHLLNDNKTEILLEIEKAKLTTLRWTYGGTIAIALGMVAAVVALTS